MDRAEHAGVRKAMDQPPAAVTAELSRRTPKEAAMDSAEAEQRFRWLEQQRRLRRISEEQYRAELNDLRVTDEYGRLWMLQEGTGQWHVWDGAQWQAASPLPEAPQPYAPPPPSGVPLSAEPEQKGGGCGKTILYLVGWAVFWFAAAVLIAYLTRGNEEQTNILLAVGLGALVSLVMLVVSLSSQWEGEIIDIRQESRRVRRGDDWYTERHTVALVREPSGRIRKVGASRSWRVGYRLQKRRGETGVRIVAK
jgi:hypothetical protein